MARDEPDHQFPRMVDDTSGQTDEGEAERLHPFCGPRFLKHQLLHRRIKIKGEDHDPPPGRVLPEVGRGELAAGEVLFHDGVGLFARSAYGAS